MHLSQNFKEHAVSLSIIVGSAWIIQGLTHSRRSRVRRTIRYDEDEGTSADDNEPYTLVEEFMEPSQSIDGHDNFNDIANMTRDAWIQMQLDLGMRLDELIPFHLDDEDVALKQNTKYDTIATTGDSDDYPDEPRNPMDALRRGAGRRRKNQGAKNSLKKFRLRDVPKLHSKMVEVHQYRTNVLLGKFVKGAEIQYARKKPAILLSDTEKEIHQITDDYKYPDFEGNDKTHVQIQKFLDEFGWNERATNLFATGKAQIWFLIPGAVPLFGNAKEHVGEYDNYWRFIQKFGGAFEATKQKQRGGLRISVGLWQKGAVFSPRGAAYRAGRFPWKRVRQYYMRPRSTTAMGYILETTDAVSRWVGRFGKSTVSTGRDCFVIWFHQDFAADAAKLLVPEEFMKLDHLYGLCTVMHIFVGFNQYNADVHRYAAAFRPELQNNFAKDPDFSGVFFADSLPSVGGDNDLFQKVTKFMTVVKNRASCRLREKGWIPPVPQDPVTLRPPTAESIGQDDLPTQSALDFVTDNPATGMPMDITGMPDADLTGLPMTGGPQEYGDIELTQAPTNFRALLEIMETPAPKVPEIDSCCGHGVWTGIPFDSELRTCCSTGKVVPWTDGDADPCTSEDAVFNR